MRWIWDGHGAWVSLLRLALVPASALYWLAILTRVQLLRTRRPEAENPVPVICVGNLVVGGTGKTPLVQWVVKQLVQRSYQPAVVLRGYRRDETLLHRDTGVSNVIENRDRSKAIEQAAARGAEVVVMDDGFQRLQTNRDLDIVLLAAEDQMRSPWLLPAGPWRERYTALSRADVVVVTRKTASADQALDLLNHVRPTLRPGVATGAAHLNLARFITELGTGFEVQKAALRGRLVGVVAGIAHPFTLVEQCKAIGAKVTCLPFPDHHEFTTRDLNKIVLLSRRVDYVVTTEKDAVKLRPLWPKEVDAPMVGMLDVDWESGEAEVLFSITQILAKVGGSRNRRRRPAE